MSQQSPVLQPYRMYWQELGKCMDYIRAILADADVNFKASDKNASIAVAHRRINNIITKLEQYVASETSTGFDENDSVIEGRPIKPAPVVSPI